MNEPHGTQSEEADTTWRVSGASAWNKVKRLAFEEEEEGRAMLPWSEYPKQCGKDCARIGIYFGGRKALSMSVGM